MPRQDGVAASAGVQKDNPSAAQPRLLRSSSANASLFAGKQSNTGTKRGAAPPSVVLIRNPEDGDQEGQFLVDIGTLIDRSPDFPNGRYRIIEILGSGKSFGAGGELE